MESLNSNDIRVDIINCSSTDQEDIEFELNNTAKRKLKNRYRGKQFASFKK